METVIVEIRHDEIIDLNPRISFEMFVIGKLRQAGIPVIGIFSFKGVSRGTLKCIDSMHKNIKQFIWNSE